MLKNKFTSPIIAATSTAVSTVAGDPAGTASCPRCNADEACSTINVHLSSSICHLQVEKGMGKGGEEGRGRRGRKGERKGGGGTL